MEGKGIDIILVEDNDNDAELTIRALRKNNPAVRVLHLKDGAQALEYLLSDGFATDSLSCQPKLILLDLKMPKVDGLEVLNRLKSDNRTLTIPVVILTSSKENSDLKKSYALGVNSYVVKPVEFELYSNMISEMGKYWMMINQLPA